MKSKPWIVFCLGFILSVGSSVDVSIESEFTSLFTSNVLSATTDISLTADIDITSSSESFEIPDGLVLTITSSSGSFRITRHTGTASLFLVSSGGTLSLKSLQISSFAEANGGAVSIEDGGVLSASEVGFMMCNSTGLGGSIYNEGYALVNSTDFRGGSAQVSGGAIYSTNTSTTEMNYVSFRDMSAVSLDGGAIYNLGHFTLHFGTFINNFAFYDGADIKVGKYANLSATDFTSTDALVSLGSGGSVHSLGSTSLARVTMTRPYAYTKGGAISVFNGHFHADQLVVIDANLDTGSGSSQGGGMYVGTAGTLVTGSGISFNSTDPNLYMGPHFDLGKGGGVYLAESTVMNVSNLVCDGISAANGPCLFAFSASFSIIGGSITRCFGFDEANQAAAMYLESDCRGIVTDLQFASNRLHPLNSAQKGAAIYMLASELVMERVSFFNHSSVGSGGAIYAESLSVITAKDLNVSYSTAITGLGGFLYGVDSSVTINGIVATKCQAVPDGEDGGQGGVIAVSSCYKLIVKNAYFFENEANEGGAIYVNQLFDSPDTTTTDDYFGAQVYDSVFERNNATYGGAIYGKQSILYVTGSRFTDNVASTGEGSTLNLALDIIVQHSTIETSVEMYNGTMIEAIRLALDNTTITSNNGYGVRIASDTGSIDADDERFQDKTYYIMSRNSDLSGTHLTSSLGNGFWDTLSCDNAAGDRSEWAPDNTIPSLVSQLVTFAPACPTSAACTEDATLKTFLCTCASSAYHKTIYNSDQGCLDADTTLSPTPLPTPDNGIGNDDADDANAAVSKNTTYVLTDSAKVLGVTFDMSDSAASALFGSLGLVALIVFLSAAVDCAKFDGPSDDSLEDRTLFVMSKVPFMFHLLLCTDRKRWVDLVLAYDDAAADKAEQDVENPNTTGKKGRNKEGRKSRRRTKKGGDGPTKRKTKKDTAFDHQALL